jgi:butyrate kinase
MSANERILVLNPGSTTTKVAIFEGEKCILEDTIRHSKEDLAQFEHVSEQRDYRESLILAFLSEHGIALDSLDGTVGRGGLMRPIKSGTYAVNDAMLEDLENCYLGEHASNLGAALAYETAREAGVPAFVVDPVVVDEMNPLARFSGVPELPRTSIAHALNIKATARRVASEMGRELSGLNLIFAHMGGGTSVVAIRQGKMTDVSGGISAGPFTPERAGSVPILELVDMCFSGDFAEAEVKKKLMGGGGLVAYLGTNDAREVEKRIHAGDKEAELVMDAMIYQIAKEIGAMATVLEGKVDAVIMTGGLANSEYIMGRLADRVGFIGKIVIAPGEDELEALALGCLRVLRGEEEALEYPGG